LRHPGRKTKQEIIMKVINPATEEIIREVNEDSPETLSKKFSLLKSGQPRWQLIPIETRIAIINEFSALLEKNIEQCSSILTSEVGKPLQQSRNEVNGARSRIKWLTGNALKYLSDEVMTVEENLQEVISYEPLGVICNISAWNYPYLVGVNVFVPALLGGNSVMYKPSEFSTLTGLQISNLLLKAGVPGDAFQVAIGGKDTGEALLNMNFDGYFFTGSHRTGKYIYERVSSKMVQCQCELGGKDPLYVADDISDIKSVAGATADGAFYNNGQSCCAVERIYVHEKIYDQYIDEFIKEVNSYRHGDPLEAGVYIGPLTRKDQVNVLKIQIDDAKQKGARIRLGGKQLEKRGYYFEPTVLTEVDHTMKIMKDESFGPVIGIMKVRSDEEAVSLMNDSDYGLTASVYSSDESRAKRILSQINAGTGYWNCCDRVSAALPWSGRKSSGIGSTLSHAGLRAFVHPKAYHLKN
jgi:acyl-CoA reductase-like NAD-dependent aldehyde dehydrogenase